MLSVLLTLFLGIGIASAAESGLVIQAEPVALSSTAPRGAQRVPMLGLNLQASCNASVSVNTITVQHEGLGDVSDIAAVYVFQNNKRVTRATTFQRRDGRATLCFRGFSLKPCEHTKLMILVDISANAASGGRHAVNLRSSKDIDAGESIVTIQTPLTARLTQTAPISQGTISIAYLNLPRRVDFGSDRIVSRFTLEADGEANQLIDAITLTNDGKATGADLRNLWLGTTRGERVTAILDTLDGNKARLLFEDPFVLARNTLMQFQLHADVRASRTRTIHFEIDEASDIEARSVRGRIR